MTPKELKAARAFIKIYDCLGQTEYRMEERLKKCKAIQPDNQLDIDYTNAAITLDQTRNMKEIAQNAVFQLVRE
jgi:hypothetical protein